MAAARSQNGYSANDRSKIGSFLVPGTSTRLAVRKGNVARVLLYVAREFDRTVEDIDTASSKGFVADHLTVAGSAGSKVHDDWGFAPRNVRGSATVLSNHASGTAIDLNATQHPRGVTGTFTAEQIRAVRKILAYCEGVIRWGQDYRNAPIDGMHLEVVGSSGQVAKVAKKIKAKYAAEAAALRKAKRTAALAAAKKRAAAAKAKAAAALATKKRKAAAAAAAALLLTGGGAVLTQGGGAPPSKPGAVATPAASPSVSPTVKPTPKPTTAPTRKPTVKPKPTLSRTLRYSKARPFQRGAEVKRVQRLVGLTGKAVDGDYGPMTASKVRAWQGRHGLAQSGQFGRREALKAGWGFTA